MREYEKKERKLSKHVSANYKGRMTSVLVVDRLGLAHTEDFDLP